MLRVQSLSHLLHDVEIVLHTVDLTSEQKIRGASILEGCDDLLKKLEETLGKYKELGSDTKDKSKGFHSKERRVWKRLKWEPKDVGDLRSQLASHVLILNGFTGNITQYLLDLLPLYIVLG